LSAPRLLSYRVWLTLDLPVAAPGKLSKMSKPTVAIPLPEVIGPGRQPDPISAVQLPANLTAAIDVWAEEHQLSRSEAIQGLIEIGLKVKPSIK
jgi:hypothetical protein